MGIWSTAPYRHERAERHVVANETLSCEPRRCLWLVHNPSMKQGRSFLFVVQWDGSMPLIDVYVVASSVQPVPSTPQNLNMISRSSADIWHANKKLSCRIGRGKKEISARMRFRRRPLGRKKESLIMHKVGSFTCTSCLVPRYGVSNKTWIDS